MGVTPEGTECDHATESFLDLLSSVRLGSTTNHDRMLLPLKKVKKKSPRRGLFHVSKQISC